MIKKKIFLIVPFVLGLIMVSFAQTPKQQQYLDVIFNAFKTKNYELIKPLLDPNVKIGTVSRGQNDVVVPTILKWFPEPVSYQVTKTTKEGNGNRIITVYKYVNGDMCPQGFLFDAQGKITDFDLAVPPSLLPQPGMPANLPDHMEIPFEVNNKIIFIKCILNGKEEYFMFDSGAPGLILNASHFGSTLTVDPNAHMQGTGGSAGAGVQHVNALNFSSLEMKNFDATAMLLGNLEKSTNHLLAGIIGYKIFKDYELTFDYAKKTIIFSRTIAQGEVIGGETIKSDYTVVSFVMKTHFPVLDVTIHGKTYHMGLDCGVSRNLLYAKYMPLLGSDASNYGKTVLSGAGKNQLTISTAEIKNMIVGGIEYPSSSFLFDDSTLDQSNVDYGLGIDGLLGYDFLYRHKISVNYKKGEMRISKS